MKRKYRATKTAFCMLAVALFLQLVEYGAGQKNMEFRTFFQEIKGIYNWLVVPITLVFSVYNDFFKEKVRFRLRYLGPVILTIFIVGAALFRGFVYFFNMVSEEKTEDGMIRGEIFAFSGTRYVYYEPVWGIFRTPFQGWSKEEIAAYLAERYGEGITYVERAPGGEWIYKAPGGREGSPDFYFCVWNHYVIEDNFEYSLTKSDASGFWKDERKREVYFINSNGLFVEADSPGEWNTESCPQNKDRIVVCCYSQADVKTCAVDIADWIFYEFDDGKYSDFREEGTSLYSIFIRYAGEKEQEFLFEISREIRKNDWAGLYQKIAQRLEEYAESVEEKREAKEVNGEDSEEISMEEWASGYMANYDPFDSMGMGVDFTFLDENFGFAALMHQGGDEAELYVTEDGGASYERCMMQGLTVTLDHGHTFSFKEMQEGGESEY